MFRFTPYLFLQSPCYGPGDAIKVYQIKNGPSPSTYIMRMACHQMMRMTKLLQETVNETHDIDASSTMDFPGWIQTRRSHMDG